MFGLMHRTKCGLHFDILSMRSFNDVLYCAPTVTVRLLAVLFADPEPTCFRLDLAPPPPSAASQNSATAADAESALTTSAGNGSRFFSMNDFAVYSTCPA